MHHSSPVFPPSVAQRIAHAVAAPATPKPRAGDYSINRAFLGSSLHLFLLRKGQSIVKLCDMRVKLVMLLVMLSLLCRGLSDACQSSSSL